MVIKEVQIKNFRAIRDETLSFDHLTLLVGKNGAGKSSFLHALDFFYGDNAKIVDSDFYADDNTAPIEVRVTFWELSNAAKEKFRNYLQGDELAVTRVAQMENGKVVDTYHGVTLLNPEFRELRDARLVKDNLKTAKERFVELKAQPKYEDLPDKLPKKDDIESMLEVWEAAHVDQCALLPDDGQFFGFKQVAKGYLGRFTRFLFVPAVREAADDAQDGKDSVMTKILDLLVRNVLAGTKEYRELRDETQVKYEELLDPEKRAELKKLGADITSTLASYVAGAAVDLSWLPLEEVRIPLPKAEIKLTEDNYSAHVNKTGHGLQRAFILTILQHLKVVQAAPQVGAEGAAADPAQAGEPEYPDLVLAIEEPELYQHPNRQRHFAKVLYKLAHGQTAGVARKTQVIYTTHSPHFVGLDRIDHIRLFRKKDAGEGVPKITKAFYSKLADIAQKLAAILQRDPATFTAETLRARLHSIMTTTVNEGFFSDLAVLVEGEDDKAALLGMAQLKGVEIESLGISIIPCGGKNNLDRPALIFSSLEIPVYLVWDNDKGASNEAKQPPINRALCKIAGIAEEDFPFGAKDKACVFPGNLESVFKAELSAEVYSRCLAEAQDELEVSEGSKNPAAMHLALVKAVALGKRATTLEQALEKIVALRG